MVTHFERIEIFVCNTLKVIATLRLRNMRHCGIVTSNANLRMHCGSIKEQSVTISNAYSFIAANASMPCITVGNT
jgi:hypothetical protein